jgi:hypothetical protein
MDLREWSLIDVFYSTEAHYEKDDISILIKFILHQLFLIKNIQYLRTNDDIFNLIYDLFLYHDKRLSIYNFHYINNIEEKNEYYKSYNKDCKSLQILKKIEMKMIDITDLFNQVPFDNLVFNWGIQYKNSNTDKNLFVSLITMYNNRIQDAIKIQNDIKKRIRKMKNFAMLKAWINKDHCSIICNANYIKKQEYQEMTNPCMKCQSMEFEMLFSDISNRCKAYHCKICQHHHKDIYCPRNRKCNICKKFGHYENKCRYK